MAVNDDKCFMLRNSFQHMPGIGPLRERRLWSAGILDWDVVVNGISPRFIRSGLETLSCMARESAARLAAGDIHYFADRLPVDQHWRLFADFRGATAYLDIETYPFASGENAITTIALYDGRTVRHYINGRNLEAFVRDIARYTTIVSYNGKAFDVPFIEKYFRTKLCHAHIDLRFVLKSLGYTGGLKGCEAKLGIERGELQGLDGYFAVLLWHDYYHNNNSKALETLLAYNIEDTVNLETLMVMAYNLKIRETPFGKTHALPLPQKPFIPFKAHPPTIARLKMLIKS